MKKRRSTSAQTNSFGEPLSWLPIDSRLLPPIFSFSHVRGLPRIFLIIEIILSICIVLGTLFIAVIKGILYFL